MIRKVMKMSNLGGHSRAQWTLGKRHKGALSCQMPHKWGCCAKATQCHFMRRFWAMLSSSFSTTKLDSQFSTTTIEQAFPASANSLVHCLAKAEKAQAENVSMSHREPATWSHTSAGVKEPIAQMLQRHP